MKSVSYGTKICRDLEVALKKEWDEKSDSGAYAASSILGANTKPSHGLLVVPATPFGKPSVLLSSLEETVFIGDHAYPLSTHLYAKAVYPKGFEYLEHFYSLPFPTWIFRLEGLAFVKMVIMIGGENSVLIRYQLLSSYGDFVRFQLRPIFAFRSTTESAKEDPKAVPKIRATQGTVYLESPNKCPSLYLSHNAAVVDRAGVWFKGLHYPDSSSAHREEDLYSPFALHYAFLKEDGVYLSASTSDERKFDPFLIGVKEKNRRKNKG